MTDARRLAESKRGHVVAAAGCGKTHLIADAVRNHGAGRELILTHTNAGVSALRDRLREFGVAQGAFVLDTMAGWSLGLALAFPKSSGLKFGLPVDNEWDLVYPAATKLLDSKSIQRILRASYTGVYVDEYQDCTVTQHELVMALARTLPCRVLGDPLQGIFDFTGQPVIWPEHVEKNFDCVAELRTPHRWTKANPALGEWLGEARKRLAAGEGLDLAPLGPDLLVAPVTDFNARLSACRKLEPGKTGHSIAVCEFAKQGERIARMLAPQFEVVERMDLPDLTKFARELEGSRGAARALSLVEFAGQCRTGIKESFKSVLNNLKEGKTDFRRIRVRPEGLDELERVIADDKFAHGEAALRAMERDPESKLFRRDLWREGKRLLVAQAEGSEKSMLETAFEVRAQTRRYGCRRARFSVGRPTLIKGLQYDHALVLDPAGFNARYLYVALTRGCRKLTVVSHSPKWTPP